MAVNVKSEIGELKKVILHRPGKELENLTPDTLEELLFDDIPYLKVARQEHDHFASLLQQNGTEVFYLEQMMADVLDANPELRETFLKQWIEEAGIHTEHQQKAVYEYMDDIKDNKALVDKTMEGIVNRELGIEKTSSLVDFVADDSDLVADPMPNLYFTRDPFALIGNGVSLNRMYAHTRNRETIYGEYIFKYHPELVGTPLFYDRYKPFHIEGGDILNLTSNILAIGISQRTQAAAIDDLARNVFYNEESTIDTILAIDIPWSRAFMHLDTVFTMIDHDKFTVHPGILGPLRVFELKADGKGGIKVKEINSTLEGVLSEYIGMPAQLILCGGDDRIAGEREQWNDGSNTLTIAPGKIVVYDRNEVSNKLLEEAGIELVSMPGAELVRGRGGPRCMSMPIWRENV